MDTSQKWYETDETYNERIAQEASERTIENLTGSAPTPRWYETDATYGERIAQEASKCIIEESTGSAPTPHWYETDTTYSERIAQEANERKIEDSTGSAPTTHWYESDNDYDTRIRKEANEQIVKDGTGSSPKQRWFEGDHNYRSRIANEAREVRARERSNPSTSSNPGSPSVSGTASSYLPSSSSHSGSDSTIAARALQGLRQEIGRQKAAIANGWKDLGIAVIIVAGLFLAAEVCGYLADPHNANPRPHSILSALGSMLRAVLGAVGALGVIVFGLAAWIGIVVVLVKAVMQLAKVTSGRTRIAKLESEITSHPASRNKHTAFDEA